MSSASRNKIPVVILGSTNWDICMYLPTLPKPGETVANGLLEGNLGGKGANQAVACHKAGAQMRFISAVGEDATANTVFETFTTLELNAESILRKPTTTGTACIFIDENAENCIGLTAGANGLLNENDVDAEQALIANADFLLMQLETPLATIEYAADMARKANTTVVLNPAPAALLPDSLMSKIDIITPNRVELGQLAEAPVDTEAQVLIAARKLQQLGINMVVVTLGSEGVLIVDGEEQARLSARQVNAIDTTAAGDTFNGFFVAMLAEGKSPEQAARVAADAASLSVTRKGAIPSIPTITEVVATTN